MTARAVTAQAEARKAAARDTVLNTSELLEIILVYLPHRDIYCVQRVFRQFKDAIETSPVTQTKLFKRLIEPEDRVWSIKHPSYRGARDGEGPVTKADPSAAISSSYFGTVSLNGFPDRIHEFVNGSINLRPAKLTPVLFLDDSPSPFSIREWPHIQKPQLILFDQDEMEPLEFLKQSFMDSRRSSYLTDPPCREAAVSIHLNAVESTTYVWHCSVQFVCHVESDTGLTLGDMYEALATGKGEVRIRRLRQDSFNPRLIGLEARLSEIIGKIRTKRLIRIP